MFKNYFSPKIVPFMRKFGEIWFSRKGYRWKHNTPQCALNAEGTKATNTHSKYITFFFHCNIFYAKAPQCYVIHTLSFLFRWLTLWRLTTYIYIYICRNAQLTSRRCILNIYSTNILTEYFKHAAHSPLFFFFKMPFIS